MSRPSRIGRVRGVGATVATVVAMLALPSLVLGAEPEPKFTTGGVAHATATSGLLEGSVNTEGFATSYIFEYGPTLTYGGKTKPVAVPIPSPPKTVKVGQQVTGLLAGYHYRIVGIYTSRATGMQVEQPGHDKVFSAAKANRLRFASSTKGKENRVSTVYGGTATLTGSLTGLGNGERPLTLQETPFPFTAPFTTLSGTVLSTRTGSFTFKVARLTQITEFRFSTLDPRPLFSPPMVVNVTPRITLHVKGSGTGLYRIYGTVAPARTGAGVVLQQLLPQKAGSKHEGPRAHAVASTVLKRLNSTSSRYSVIAKLTGTGHYRIFVHLPKGALESGHSSNVEIRSPKKTTAK
jgi:hypothetical protein